MTLNEMRQAIRKQAANGTRIDKRPVPVGMGDTIPATAKEPMPMHSRKLVEQYAQALLPRPFLFEQKMASRYKWQ
jgi:hypothetical protein